MKYTIFRFQQEKLVQANIGLDEALVMNTIWDLYFTEEFESLIEDEQRYIWVKQDVLLQRIPIIGSMSKLKRILKRLTEEGYFETKLVTNKSGKAGRYFYIKYTQKLYELSEYGSKVQNDTRPNVKMTLNQSSKWTNKESSNNYPSDNDNNTIMSVVNYYKENCKSLPQPKTITDQRKKHIKARLDDYGYDEVIKALKVAEASEFLTKGPDKGWLSFDWIFNPNNFVKIVEGKYGARQKKSEPKKNFFGEVDTVGDVWARFD